MKSSQDAGSTPAGSTTHKFSGIQSIRIESQFSFVSITL